MEEQIRPIYNELQGYLSQAPNKDKTYIFEAEIWEQVNQTIDELTDISGIDFEKFKLRSKSIEWNGRNKTVVIVSDFRSKLNGLINNLHGKFFSKENPPFSGVPGPNINMTQSQNQTVYVQMLLEMQSIIDRKLSETTDPKETSFLKKIKDSLPSVTNAMELVKLILSTGSSLGLEAEKILNIIK